MPEGMSKFEPVSDSIKKPESGAVSSEVDTERADTEPRYEPETMMGTEVSGVRMKKQLDDAPAKVEYTIRAHGLQPTPGDPRYTPVKVEKGEKKESQDARDDSAA